MKSVQIISIFFLAGFAGQSCLAADVSEDAERSIRAMFKENSEVQITPYRDSLLEISIGPKTLFASADGQYIFSGAVVDTKTGVNIVELKDKQYRQRRLLELAPDMYMSFPASTTEQHTVTVFTDIDCTYCRRLHLSMSEYNELGITVNYVMLPRAGLNSPSYEKAASVFCSSNPTENMTLAMRDEFSQKNQCEHKIAEQYQLAGEFGINATPTMVMPDGEIKVGFLTPSALQIALDQTEPAGTQTP